MRKTLSSFLKYYRGTMIVFLCVTGIFAVFSWLYGVPIKAVGYAMILCGALLVVVGVVKFRGYFEKYRYLHDLQTGPNFDLADLPEQSNDVELAYAQLIQRLYREKKELVVEAEERVRSAREYYTLWVHQIKTPMAAMRLLLQAEKEIVKEELSEELFEIEQYVEMVLSYVRLESETSDYVIDYFDLDKIIRQAVRKYAQVFIRKKISLDFQQSGLQVLTDEKWLQFIIEQLLSNALKYTARGTISVWVNQETKTLIIEDQGIGIANEDIPRIFEQGFTGYNGRDNKKSTGIGLYLVKCMVKKLSHTIEIQSTVGQGTRVMLGLSSEAGELGTLQYGKVDGEIVS